jgi:hypothetical protein
MYSSKQAFQSTKHSINHAANNSNTHMVSFDARVFEKHFIKKWFGGK